MLLCRILSIFFLLYTVACESVTAKNVSQEILEINEKKQCVQDNHSKEESGLNDIYEDTDQTLTCSAEANSELEESNATFSDESLLDDDRYGHVIETFINDMEVFWQEVKSIIAEGNNKSQLAGNWWNGDTEHKYNEMKSQFYDRVPKELPQKVKDIIHEYEMRYNDLMWSDIENMIIKQVDQESNISQPETYNSIDTNIKGKVQEQSNGSIKDSTIDGDTCKKRSFEDVFQVKISK